MKGKKGGAILIILIIIVIILIGIGGYFYIIQGMKCEDIPKDFDATDPSYLESHPEIKENLICISKKFKDCKKLDVKFLGEINKTFTVEGLNDNICQIKYEFDNRGIECLYSTEQTKMLHEVSVEKGHPEATGFAIVFGMGMDLLGFENEKEIEQTIINKDTGMEEKIPCKFYRIGSAGYFCDYDFYGEFDSSDCFKNKNEVSLNKPIDLSKSEAKKKSISWPNLFIVLHKNESKNILLETATLSNTECTISVSINPNEEYTTNYNQYIYPKESSVPERKILKASDSVNISIEKYVDSGIKSFKITPSPRGCDLLIKSIKVE